MLRSLACLLALAAAPALLPATGHAQPGATLAARPPAREEPRVALTMSPLHLIVPLLEVTAELRVAPRVGLGVTGGVGGFRDASIDRYIRLAEVGVSPRVYLLGSFRKGLQLGAEAQYVHASADDLSGANVRVAGLAIGPYLGAKWTGRSGLTLEAQGGVAYLAMRGDGGNEEASRTLPILNLQIGYSF